MRVSMTFARTFVRIVSAATLVTFGLSCAGTEDNAGPKRVETRDADVLSITERDYEFAVGGEPRAGTLTIDVQNAGKEWHELAMVKLKSGVTLDDVLDALPKTDEDENAFDAIAESKDSPIDDLGGSQFPGTKYAITGSGVEAGEYALMCFARNADDKPHWSLGMLAAFSIAERENDRTPTADVTYTADDDELDGPDELDAGETTLAFGNDSKISREINLIKLKRGKTVADFAKLMEAGEGPPDPKTAPIDFFTFVFDAKQTRYIKVDLTPGEWIVGLQDPEHASEKPPGEDPFAKVVTVG